MVVRRFNLVEHEALVDHMMIDKVDCVLVDFY